jgi:carbon monoxide dehydrogenase subunit G
LFRRLHLLHKRPSTQAFGGQVPLAGHRRNSVASIRKEIQVRREREVVWDAIRDVGAIHKRLVPGFVVDCRLEGDSRYLTFGNGMTIREIIVDVDDQNYRHAWSARGAPFTHHNASIQVFAEGDASCRLVWIADLLPNDVAAAVAEMIQQGLTTMKATLEAR